jgi:hypothetical protein
MNASRTLLKSPPELWSECSDAASLAKHLGAFGEIRITKLEPEIAVAWEGAAARGTVRLEPSGWGTRVVLTAEPTSDPTAAVPEPGPIALAPEPDHSASEDPAPEAVALAAATRPSLFARILSLLPLRSAAPQLEPEPEPQPEPVAESTAPESVAPAPSRSEDALNDALDSLGRAHHRPYSRS